MADIGLWTGGTIGSITPGTTWAAGNGIFPTQARNDSSIYTWTSSTCTVTLPSSGLADGYLFLANLEYETSGTGRFNLQGRITQTAGTGNTQYPEVSGFARDVSEDRAFLQCWCFCDSPSASAEFTFEWKRDTDTADVTDGTVNSSFTVIPFYYSNIGMYVSNTANAYGGTTPNQVSINGTTYESDTNAISRSGSVITIKGDNKKYVILGGVYGEGFSAGTRRQRMIGLGYDGTLDDATRSYFYARQASCDNNGAITWDLHETATADETVELMCWAGDSYTDDGGGQEDTGTSTPTAAKNVLVIVELNDSAEGFRSHDGTGLQSFTTAGTDQIMNIARTTDIDFNDSAAFTRASDTAFNCEKAMDVFAGANVAAARQTAANTTRSTIRAQLEIASSSVAHTRHGNYSRGDQAAAGTLGIGMNPGGLLEVTTGNDISVRVGKISGSEAGNDRTQPGWVGFWGVNLDSLDATPAVGWDNTINGVSTYSKIDGVADTAIQKVNGV